MIAYDLGSLVLDSNWSKTLTLENLCLSMLVLLLRFESMIVSIAWLGIALMNKTKNYHSTILEY